MKWKISLFLILYFLFAHQGVFSQMATYIDAPRQFSGPQAYKDKDSGIIFYVESDGRHVVAINPEGKILWCRDPFADAKLEPYRLKLPLIVYIGKPNEWQIKGREKQYIAISFNSSQFGIMDFENGDFIFQGQD